MPVKVIFFFSSRRRHTRSTRDWSSDVCSSDLAKKTRASPQVCRRTAVQKSRRIRCQTITIPVFREQPSHDQEITQNPHAALGGLAALRQPFGGRGQIGRASCRERV